MRKLSEAFAAERAERGIGPENPEVQARYAFAGTVLAVRRAAGLSQRQLADRTGVPQSEISRIERGLTVPTLTRANALLNPLGWKLAAMPIHEREEARELVAV